LYASDADSSIFDSGLRARPCPRASFGLGATVPPRASVDHPFAEPAQRDEAPSENAQPFASGQKHLACNRPLQKYAFCGRRMMAAT